MKFIRRFNESQLIKVTDDTIFDIVQEEILKLGYSADLNHIDVSDVTSMWELFKSETDILDNSKFDGDISEWNTKNVEDMGHMFSLSKFNGDISQWDISNVINMNYMFAQSKFNRDISNWNIENVRDMMFIFSNSKFNGDLDKWKPYSYIHNSDIFFKSIIEFERRPIWYHCLQLGLFQSGKDYCDSLVFDWLRGKTIVMGRLKLAIDVFDGNLNNIDKVKNLKGYNFEN